MNLNYEMTGMTPGHVPEPNKTGAGMELWVPATLAAWLGAVSWLGAQGVFAGRAGGPPLALLAGVVLPLAVFLTAYTTWSAFRSFVLNADLRLVTAIQAWRWAGLGFLTLYAYGILPGIFALPAGLGDMAVGVTAPWMLRRLASDPAFAISRRYVLWNIFGIVDFAVALSIGALASGFLPAMTHLTGGVTSSPMGRLPLILIPAFMVPCFVMLHMTALFQARQRRRATA
jgi:hypothetical protein